MFYLSGVVGFLLVLTAEGRIGNSSLVSFCTESEECLLFDQICKTNKYEVRHYDSVKMVSTNETSLSMDLIIPQLFRRLFKYITGENQDGVKIDMTTPVIVRTPEVAFLESGVFTMSFVLPAEHQKNPPKPTSNNVYIHETPDMNVYVKSYSGWMMSLTDDWQLRDLSNSLDSVKAKYTKGFHYSVGYNSPFRLFDRHNEVWLEVEGKPVCPSRK